MLRDLINILNSNIERSRREKVFIESSIHLGSPPEGRPTLEDGVGNFLDIPDHSSVQTHNMWMNLSTALTHGQGTYGKHDPFSRINFKPLCVCVQSKTDNNQFRTPMLSWMMNREELHYGGF